MSGGFQLREPERVHAASPLSKRGEDEGEGFDPMHANPILILTLPLSFQKNEAIQHTPDCATNSAQT